MLVPMSAPSFAHARDALPTLDVLRQRSVGLWGALPDDVVALAQIFADAGHELALVGGPVRDAFLGSRHLGQYLDLLTDVIRSRPAVTNRGTHGREEPATAV